MAKSTLVTGGAGLIRSHLVDQLPHAQHASAVLCFTSRDITHKIEQTLNNNTDIVVMPYQPDDINEKYACDTGVQTTASYKLAHLAE